MLDKENPSYTSRWDCTKFQKTCKNNAKLFSETTLITILCIATVFDFSPSTIIFILFGRENIFLVLLWEFFMAVRIFLLLREFFFCREIFFFFLLREFFHCCDNFFFVARIFFTVLRILFLLREFLYCWENSFFVVRIFLLLWEFFSPKQKKFGKSRNALVDYVDCLRSLSKIE